MSMTERMGLTTCIVLIAALANQMMMALGGGTISVRLDRYTNPGGKGDNGNCCDGIGFICNGQCDHYFHVCLDMPTSSDEHDMTLCPLGDFQTDITRERNSITFGSTIGSTANPQLKHFDGAWPGGAKFKVDVWDHDSRTGNTNDFVDFLSVTFYITPGGTVHEVELDSRTTLHVSVSVTCDDDWMGAECDVYCPPGNNYQCDETSGQKVCDPGWEGVDCNIDTDECASQPCDNGATCHDSVNDFFCLCQLGFAGEHCEREATSCSDDPCHATATCTDERGDAENPFFCTCDENFQGRLCNEPIMPCDRNPCQNGGVCGNNDDNTYDCLCTSGWTGEDCSESINECLSNPCGPHQLCDDIIGGYMCNCRAGWMGDDCTQSIDDCVVSECAEGATCVDGHNSYTCECPSGRTGAFCNETLCGDHQCQNGGYCNRTGGVPECQCMDGYEGPGCGIFSLCREQPCMHGGVCADNPTEQAWCTCDENYTGARCDMCLESRLVPTEANCTDAENCGGLMQWFPITCPNPPQGCLLEGCENEGMCLDSGECQCTWNTFGDRCQHTMPHCRTQIRGDEPPVMQCMRAQHDSPPNASVCWQNGYSWGSQPLAKGRRRKVRSHQCYVESPCVCINGGQCVSHGEVTSCRCPQYYTGDRCQTRQIEVPPVSTQSGHVTVNFMLSLTGDEMQSFILKMHSAASKALDMPRQNISVYHQQYACKRLGGRGGYTALSFDIFANGDPITQNESRAVVEDIAYRVSGSTEDFQLRSLDRQRCVLTDITRPSINAQSTADGFPRHILFYLIVAGCVFAVLVLVLGMLYWRVRRKAAYSPVMRRNRKSIEAERTSMRPMLYDPIDPAGADSNRNSRYSGMYVPGNRTSTLSYR